MFSPKTHLAWLETPVSLIPLAPSAFYLGSCHSPSPKALTLATLTPSPFPRILFWTDWDASLPRIEAASMSGAGRRTIHRETGSGGWPNGLTVDYLEKRILWIDARSVPSTTPRRPSSPPPLQGQGGPGSQNLVVGRMVRSLGGVRSRTRVVKGWAQQDCIEGRSGDRRE